MNDSNLQFACTLAARRRLARCVHCSHHWPNWGARWDRPRWYATRDSLAHVASVARDCSGIRAHVVDPTSPFFWKVGEIQSRVATAYFAFSAPEACNGRYFEICDPVSAPRGQKIFRVLRRRKAKSFKKHVHPRRHKHVETDRKTRPSASHRDRSRGGSVRRENEDEKR